MTETLVARWKRQHEAGRRLCSQGELAQAEQAYRTAVEEALALGDDDLRVARSLTELGQLKCKQGDFEQAEELLSRALAIHQGKLGAEHFQVAQSLTHLGALYYLRGDLDRAEPLFKDALVIGERELGAEHPALTILLENPARLSFKRNDYAAATPLLTRLLALKERTLGGEHPEVATVVTALSRCRSVEGNHDEAEALARRALAIRERTLPPSDPAIAASLDLLAHYCAARAKREEVWAAASSVLRSAPDASQAHGGPDTVCETLREEARALAERARAIRSQSATPAEPTNLETAPVAPVPTSVPASEMADGVRLQEPPREVVSGGSSSSGLADHSACAAADDTPQCANVSSLADAASGPLGAVPRKDTGARRWLAGSWLVRRNQVVAASLVVLGANLWFVVRHTASDAPTTAAHTALSASLPTRASIDTAGSPGVASLQRVVDEPQPGKRQDTVSAQPSVAVRPPSPPKAPSLSARRLQRAIERVRTKGLKSAQAKVDSASRVIEATPPTFRNP
jgi:tetratricopeptide (TPR) repeat protein